MTIKTKVGKFLTDNLVARQVQGILGAYNQWSENREREKEIADLLVAVPGRNEVIVKRNTIVYETLLRNQQATFDSNSFLTQKKAKQHRADRKRFLNTVKKALNGLQETFDLVGVQPMKGPVSLVYTLQYRTDDEGKISLDILSKAVESGTRKLSAGWTLEAAQDLKAQHDLDIEGEIESVLGAEVCSEVSNEIIHDLVTLAQQATVYDFAEDKDDYGKTLTINLNRAANDIARRTRRGCGNYVLTSPAGISQLQTLLDTASLKFKPVEAPTHTCAVWYAGDIMVGDTTLHRVYCTSFGFAHLDTDDDVHYLVGYKGGNGECDTGYFFTPYVPMLNMGIVVDPVTFQPIQRFATRYGKHIVENGKDYFRLVKGTLTKPAA